MPCPLAEAAEAVERALSMAGCLASIDARAARRLFVVFSDGDMLGWVFPLGSVLVGESHWAFVGLDVR
jgi:hypothetical protein